MESGSLGSQTDFRILESQIGVLTELLICGWDLSTSQAAYKAVADTIVVPVLSCTAVVLQWYCTKYFRTPLVLYVVRVT